MTLTLNLPPEVEGALAQEAQRQGRTLEQIALEDLRRLYASEAISPPTAVIATNPMLALFAEWDAEDATDDPQVIARRNQEWEETKASLAANRLSLRRIDVSGEEWN